MASEPDYGQYWGPDGQSAQEQEGQQPTHEQQPGYVGTGYEQPGYAQSEYPQSEYPQNPQHEYGGAGYPQQPGYQPEQGYSQQPEYQQSEYQQPYGGYEGYQGYAEYQGQQQYAPEQGQGYQGEQSYAPAAGYAPEQGYPAAGQYYAGADQQGTRQQEEEQPAESTATWSAAGMYPPDGEPAAAQEAAPGGEPAADPGGSTAVGGGRSARRSARGGQGNGHAGDGQPGDGAAGDGEAGGTVISRLLAAATGRAGGDRKTFIVRAALGAAALVVLGVAGYAVAGGGSGAAKPKASAGAPSVDLAATHTKSWAAPADAGSVKGNDGLVGSWLLSDAVVRGDGMGVTAYGNTGGSALWTVAPPATGAVPCAMSSTVDASGVGVVLFQAKPGTGQPCTLLVAVDTSTGKAKWTATVPGGSTGQTSVMVSDTRVVAVAGGAATGYDVATGKQSWSYSGPGKYCVLTGNGTAGALLVQSTCADSNPKQQLISLDPGTGKLGWWRGLPQDAASYTVLSATPAVIGVHMTDPTKDTLMSFSAQGDNQATIPVSQVGGLLDSLHGTFDPNPALFFQGSTMIAELSATTAGATGGSAAPVAPGSGVVTAFDLAGGKQLWQTAPSEKGQSALVGLDGSGAVVATEERIGQPARLSHFDLATGKETPGGAFPQATGSLLTSGRVLYQGSEVAVLPQFTSTYGTAVTLYSGASTS